MKIEGLLSKLGRKSFIPLAIAGSVSATACSPCSLIGPDACTTMPPDVSNINILPENPLDRDTLYLVYSISSDGPVKEEIKWMRNNSIFPTADNQKRILPEDTRPEDIWYAKILVSNKDYNFEFKSPSVRIKD